MNHVNEITRYVNIVDYEKLRETALDTALRTGCRAVDALFIGYAKETGSILVSADRLQISSARKVGVDAYYLPEECDELIIRTQKL